MLFQADICGMDGALAFLVNLLRHKATSIVENGGGILRNISSYIAVSQEGEKFRWVAAFGEFQLWSFLQYWIATSQNSMGLVNILKPLSTFL